MNDELIQRLREPVTHASDPGLTNAERRMAADALEQLIVEVEVWKDRVEAERQAHETTIREYEKAMNE